MNDVPEGQRGSVRLNVRDDAGRPVEGRQLIMFSQHGQTRNEQARFSAEDDGEFEANLPAGVYTMAVAAPGYTPVRQLVRLDHGESIALDVTMARSAKESPTFAERLAVYGLGEPDGELSKLDVREGESVSLDYRKQRDDSDYRLLRTDNIDDIKRWLGTPDEVFPHEEPIYGPPPPVARSKEAFEAIAHEYIYGNSRSVSKYALALKSVMASFYKEGVAIIPLFLYSVVTIGPGATLTVGSGSTVFFCDELHIHRTGVLEVVGTVKLDVGSYSEFT